MEGLGEIDRLWSVQGDEDLLLRGGLKKMGDKRARRGQKPRRQSEGWSSWGSKAWKESLCRVG